MKKRGQAKFFFKKGEFAEGLSNIFLFFAFFWPKMAESHLIILPAFQQV